MTIKTYLPYMLLGLVRDLSDEYGDGWSHWAVSGRCPAVSMGVALGTVPLLFLLGLLLRYRFERQGCVGAVGRLSWMWKGLLIWSVLMAVGIGPYLEWYPGQRGGGFLDLALLTHILDGIVHAVYALAWALGGKAGAALSRRP